MCGLGGAGGGGNGGRGVGEMTEEEVRGLSILLTPHPVISILNMSMLLITQDCMYLHELGDDDASFTKEDMQLG